MSRNCLLRAEFLPECHVRPTLVGCQAEPEFGAAAAGERGETVAVVGGRLGLLGRGYFGLYHTRGR